MRTLTALAHFLSLLRVFIAYPFYVSVLNGVLPWVIFLAFVAGVSDFFDGFFARKARHHPSWGRFLDPFCDKIFLLAGLLGFYHAGHLELFYLLLVFLREILLGSFALYVLKKKRTFLGSQPIGKTVFVVLILMFVLFFFFQPLSFGYVKLILIVYLLTFFIYVPLFVKVLRSS